MTRISSQSSWARQAGAYTKANGSSRGLQGGGWPSVTCRARAYPRAFVFSSLLSPPRPPETDEVAQRVGGAAKAGRVDGREYPIHGERLIVDRAVLPHQASLVVHLAAHAHVHENRRRGLAIRTEQ